MNITRSFLPFVVAASLCVLAAPICADAANTASDNLYILDKTTATGLLSAQVSLYAPPNTKGQYAAPKVYPVQLLFARPDQFKFALNPGSKSEYRAAASGGVVSWIDLGTGISGQGKTVDLVDPVAIALLGSVGQLSQYAPPKEIAVNSKSLVRGAKLIPRNYGTSIASANAWFANDLPVGFEFIFVDKSRVFISVLQYKPNVATKPTDFKL